MDKRLTRNRPVTVSDVARTAQVSKATAARALGGYGSVSPDAKERILEAARLLDYRANELARTMATGPSGTVGVVVGDIENPFFGPAGRAAVDVLTAKGVDGLIVAPAVMHEKVHLRHVIARGRPLVLLDRDVPGL